MAYYDVEPFGDQRADFRAGVIAATVAAPHRRRGARALRPQDFMYFREPSSDEILSEHLKAQFGKLPGKGPRWRQ